MSSASSDVDVESRVAFGEQHLEDPIEEIGWRRALGVLDVWADRYQVTRY